jgi:large subunit ribosomal protein L24
LLVDWGGYRSMFEAEATRLVGLDVRVTGAIDARLLPSPQLTLHDIEIGRSGDEKIRARSLGIEFALGPLMRGEWRASELHLIGPQVRLGLDASGHVQAPNVAIGFDPDALSIDRLGVEDATVTLADAASGQHVTLGHVWFNGEARSLLGPFKGEGGATVGGDLYPFRLSTGRYGDDGKLKLHVNVDPVAQPLSAELDGFVSVTAGTPGFDGTLSLARPVGLAARSGTLSQPWRLNGKMKATASSALMQDFEFQYGSQDKGFRLAGVADLRFGKQPRFKGVLSGGQIDLDRALAEGDGRQLRPATAILKLTQLAGGAFRSSIPIQVGIGIDQATLGGDTVQNLRGDLSTDAKGWNLDRFEFRAPGYTQVHVSGHLAIDDNRVNFTGPAELKTNNPKALTAWLEGRPPSGQNDLQPMSLRGDLTLASDKIAIDRLSAEFDRKAISGNFTYVFAAGANPARLDAVLKAPDLDIDAAFGFGKALLAGVNVERPHDMTIAADIGHAAIAGLDARDVSARVQVGEGGLQVDRFSVADLGGAAVSARGRLATGSSPNGSVDVDLNARDMTPVTALLARFAPKAAEVLGRGAATMAPARLHARLALDGAAPATQAKLSVDGNLGAVRLAFNSETAADLTSFKSGNARVSAELNADDGKQLVAMLGLDRFVTADAGPGALTLGVSGPPNGELKVKATLKAGSLEANVSGTSQPFADKRSADLQATVTRSNFAPLRGAGGQAPLPVTLSSHIALAGDDLAIDKIEATIAGTGLRGKIAATLTAPHRLQGEIDSDRLDGPSLIAAAIGMPARTESKGTGWSWSAEPFAVGLFGDYAGRIAIKARNVDVLPQAAARDFGGTLNFDSQKLSLDDVVGDVAGGRLTGNLSFHAASDGLHAATKFTLAGADMGTLFTAGARPPIAGTLALSGEAEGSGLSPDALIGSLKGSGQFALIDGQFAGLDPRVFETVTHAIDQGLVADPLRISDIVSNGLQSGQLGVKRSRGDLTISAGQVRLGNFSADTGDAKLSVTGSLDLTSGAVDGRLVLSGGGDQSGARPDIFMALSGPLLSPAHTIDVSALTGWLTLRSIENQSKQLRAIEQKAPPVVPAPRPKSDATPNVKPARPASSARKRAPTLPPPVEVGTLPAPGRASNPASAVGVQR